MDDNYAFLMLPPNYNKSYRDDLKNHSLQLSLSILKNSDTSFSLKLIKFFYIIDIEYYVLHIDNYYIDIINICEDINRTISNYIATFILNEQYITSTITNVSHTITDINIDTTIIIDPLIYSYGQWIIKELQEIGILHTEIDLFKDDTSSRKKFKNIYDIIRNLKVGECYGNSNPIFYSKLVLYYNIQNYYENNFRIKYKDGILRNQHFENGISNFIKSDKQIVIITIIIITGDKYDHYNILYIDKIKKEIERFEPNGGYITDNFDDDFSIYLKKYFPWYKYIPTLDYCPKVGPQAEIGEILCPENSGFCVTVSQIYGFLRLMNPDYKRDEIVNVISTYNTFILRKFNTFAEMLIG